MRTSRWLRAVLLGATVVGVATACSSIIGLRDLSLEGASTPDDASHAAEDGIAETSASADAGACDADLATSAEHCGACGHDCSYGKCEQNVCVLVDDIAAPRALSVRDAFIYVGFTGGAGGVGRCATGGCLATRLTRLSPVEIDLRPDRLALDQADVYATGLGGGGVARVAVDGGSYALLRASADGDADLPLAMGIAIDASNVYWSAFRPEPGALTSCDKPNCSQGATTLAAPNLPALVSVASDGTLVWIEKNNQLRRCNPASCVPQGLADFGGRVRDLVTFGTTAYVGTDFGEISSCPVAGCTEPLSLVRGQSLLTSLTVDGDELFWAVIPLDDANLYKEAEGVIRRCKISSCAATVHDVATRQAAPVAVAVDARSIYWLNANRYDDDTAVGSLAKAPR